MLDKRFIKKKITSNKKIHHVQTNVIHRYAQNVKVPGLSYANLTTNFQALNLKNSQFFTIIDFLLSQY